MSDLFHSHLYRGKRLRRKWVKWVTIALIALIVLFAIATEPAMRYLGWLFDILNKKAIEHINEFGNFERFVNDPDYDPRLDKLVNVPEGMDEEVPGE